MGRTYLIYIFFLLYVGCKKDYNPRVYRLPKDSLPNISTILINLLSELISPMVVTLPILSQVVPFQTQVTQQVKIEEGFMV